jgi:hypothetical protein
MRELLITENLRLESAATNFEPLSSYLRRVFCAIFRRRIAIGGISWTPHEAPSAGQKRLERLPRFLNSQLHYKLLSCPHHYLRLGLTRPYHEVCWLMLDTLFPLPKSEWLEEF